MQAKTVAITGTVIAILLGVGGFLLYWFVFRKPSPQPGPEPNPQPNIRPTPLGPPTPQPIQPVPQPIIPTPQSIIVKPQDIVLVYKIDPTTNHQEWGLLWNGTPGREYYYIIKDQNGQDMDKGTVSSGTNLYSANGLFLRADQPYTASVMPQGTTLATTIAIPAATAPIIDITKINPVWSLKTGWITLNGDTDLKPQGGTKSGVHITYSINKGPLQEMSQDTCQNTNPTDNMHNGFSCGGQSPQKLQSGDTVAFTIMAYNGDNVASLITPPYTIKIK